MDCPAFLFCYLSFLDLIVQEVPATANNNIVLIGVNEQIDLYPIKFRFPGIPDGMIVTTAKDVAIIVIVNEII